MKNLLIVFVKPPFKGAIKTRLAKSIGKSAALAVYKKLLLHTKQNVLECAADKCIAYDGEIDHSDPWENHIFEKITQQGNDLGEKMHNAFKDRFEKSYEHICLIGSDIYELNPDILNQAFIHLEDHNLVLGPAADGGYYLIGMNKPHELLFNNIKWSTSEVLSKTIERAQRTGLTYSLLPVLNDIDDLEDIRPEDRDFLLG
jgi:rSAM/selenodomain-associated transferase 1